MWPGCVCVHVGVGEQLMESFFSFTFTWVLGIELREQAYTENGFFFLSFFSHWAISSALSWNILGILVFCESYSRKLWFQIGCKVLD